MAHQIFRLAEKYLYNQPLLITTGEVDSLSSYINNRDELITKQELAINSSLRPKMKAGDLGEGDIAVIPIEGALTYEETGWEALCGMTSYEGLLNITRFAIDEGFKTIVFDVNSGGGQAYGMMETARDIRELAKEKGVHTIAYVDGTSASAAYGLSAAMDEVIVNPESEVGSIGVVTKLVNTSEKDKKDGINYHYVYAGDSKIPFDAEGSFSESFLSDLQTKVETLYESFLGHVAEMRGLEKEAVRSTQAKVFGSEKALEIGLVDKIQTRSEFANYLADIQDNENNMSLTNYIKQKDNEQMKLEEMQVQLDQAIQDKETTLSQLAEQTEKMTTLNSQIEQLTAERDALALTLEEVEATAQEAAMESRKNDLSQFLAEDKLDSVFEATKSLDDSAFQTILSTYKASADSLDNSEMFKEKGISAEGNSDKIQTSSVMDLIKQRKAK